MKALVCNAYDGWQSLAIEEQKDPVAGPGMVVLDIKAAGTNFPDLLLVAGKYQMKPELPFVPGSECAGVVAALGEGVEGICLGDRVIAYTMLGGMAEKVAVPAANIVPLPMGMSFAKGAGFTTTYATSYYALKQRANLQKGESVLVLGAAGGVGLACVELAKAMGAKVIAGAGSDKKLQIAKDHGADETINYTNEDLKLKIRELTDGKGVDVLYDPVGGDLAHIGVRTMAFGGRYLIIGFASGDIPAIPLNLPLLKTASLIGVFWGAWAMQFPGEHAKNMTEMLHMFDEQKIKITVSEEVALADFKKAFSALENRKAIGKIVLVNQ